MSLRTDLAMRLVKRSFDKAFPLCPVDSFACHGEGHGTRLLWRGRHNHPSKGGRLHQTGFADHRDRRPGAPGEHYVALPGHRSLHRPISVHLPNGQMHVPGRQPLSSLSIRLSVASSLAVAPHACPARWVAWWARRRRRNICARGGNWAWSTSSEGTRSIAWCSPQGHRPTCCPSAPAARVAAFGRWCRTCPQPSLIR